MSNSEKNRIPRAGTLSTVEEPERLLHQSRKRRTDKRQVARDEHHALDLTNLFSLTVNSA